MNLAKNGIKVIKREERERLLRQEKETRGQDPNVERNIHEAKKQEPVATVTEWVNDFLRRRQHSFQ